MRSGLLEPVSRWGVLALGLLLALWGVAAMWRGWDIIQIERGWSLFIGGAAALAGGAVTMALGLVLARFDRLTQALQAPPMGRQAEAAPRPAPAPEPFPAPRKEAAEAVAVDRYESGDTTYVMFSDGSVEVRSPAGAQRFSSLAELKAHVGEGA